MQGGRWRFGACHRRLNTEADLTQLIHADAIAGAGDRLPDDRFTDLILTLVSIRRERHATGKARGNDGKQAKSSQSFILRMGCPNSTGAPDSTSHSVTVPPLDATMSFFKPRALSAPTTWAGSTVAPISGETSKRVK